MTRFNMPQRIFAIGLVPQHATEDEPEDEPFISTRCQPDSLQLFLSELRPLGTTQDATPKCNCKQRGTLDMQANWGVDIANRDC